MAPVILYPPFNSPVIQSTDQGPRFTREWVQFFTRLAQTVAPSGVGPAPADAQYLVGAANGTLTAERVVTDTSTVTWDLSTAGQAKANVPNGGIGTAQLANGAVTTAKIADANVTYAKLQNESASTLLGRGSAAGAGAPQEISLGSGLMMTGTTLSATGGSLSADYVVMSDGHNPPSPMDDGAGNFLYVGYTP